MNQPEPAPLNQPQCYNQHDPTTSSTDNAHATRRRSQSWSDADERIAGRAEMKLRQQMGQCSTAVRHRPRVGTDERVFLRHSGEVSTAPKAPSAPTAPTAPLLGVGFSPRALGAPRTPHEPSSFGQSSPLLCAQAGGRNIGRRQGREAGLPLERPPPLAVLGQRSQLPAKAGSPRHLALLRQAYDQTNSPSLLPSKPTSPRCYSSMYAACGSRRAPGGRSVHVSTVGDGEQHGVQAGGASKAGVESAVEVASLVKPRAVARTHDAWPARWASRHSAAADTSAADASPSLPLTDEQALFNLLQTAKVAADTAGPGGEGAFMKPRQSAITTGRDVDGDGERCIPRWCDCHSSTDTPSSSKNTSPFEGIDRGGNAGGSGVSPLCKSDGNG